MTLKLFIIGIPVPQGRPRTTCARCPLAIAAKKGVRGYGRPFAHIYDPPNSKEWKKDVTLQAISVKNREKWQTIEREIPVYMNITFYMPKPKSCPKSRIWPTVKPDLDNVEKAIKDALNGVLYVDDAQVCEVHKKKVYCQNGQEPGVMIELRPV